MIDTHSLVASVDLVALVGRDTALKKSGAWHAGPCPFCGGRDRFLIAPGGWRWFCRKCTDGKYLDALAYVARRESLDLHDGMDFRRACELLGAVDSLPERPRATPAPAPPQPAGPPPAEWQDRARRVIAECQAMLWADAGSRAREWLHGRGLKDDTLRRWHIGYCAGKSTDWRDVAGMSVPCGVVIPCEVGGVVWYVKVRRAIGLSKYQQVKGGRPALFGAETLRPGAERGHDVAVFVEGEFDAMLLEQEAGDVVGVATLGSATGNLDLMTWGAHLLPLARLLVAYDLDDAGKHGAATVASLTARARRVSVPAMPGVKDITDFHQAGGNLRDWLTFEMARLNLPFIVANTGNSGDAGLPVLTPAPGPRPGVPVCEQGHDAEEAWWARVWAERANELHSPLPDPAEVSPAEFRQAVAAINGNAATTGNSGVEAGNSEAVDYWQFILAGEAEAVICNDYQSGLTSTP